jgi:MFS family permease
MEARMSSLSGSAAGTPSGMTVASSTVGQHEHHWFTEPTQPAPKKYVAWLLIAQFVFFVALLGPAIVGIGLKITDLVNTGALPQDGAIGAAAVLGGVGALFATIANVIFGRLSDRTTSRWGRRRIWVVLGTVIMTVAFVIMALAPTLALATVGWAIAQLGANMTLAPFIATISDQVPRFQRGKITASLGIAQNIGILGGTYVAQFFQNQMVLMFVGPSILAIAAMIVFAFVLPDQVLRAKPERMDFRDWWETFWVSPLKFPDYALAWWSRFLVTLASFMFTTVRFFYINLHLDIPTEDVAGIISTSVLIYTAALIVSGYVAGWLSDRIGRRKVFVWGSTVLFAAGTVALSFIDTVAAFYLLEAFMGIAFGMYVGVDLALVVDVLPNPDNAGKDLGVFNIANALPQTLAPVLTGILAYVGAYPNFTLLLWVAGAAGLLGAVVIFPIKKVR